jgi:hypothetical protein
MPEHKYGPGCSPESIKNLSPWKKGCESPYPHGRSPKRYEIPLPNDESEAIKKIKETLADLDKEGNPKFYAQSYLCTDIVPYLHTEILKRPRPKRDQEVNVYKNSMRKIAEDNSYNSYMRKAARKYLDLHIGLQNNFPSSSH